jgi:hypothetical protein
MLRGLKFFLTARSEYRLSSDPFDLRQDYFRGIAP